MPPLDQVNARAKPQRSNHLHGEETSIGQKTNNKKEATQEASLTTDTPFLSANRAESSSPSTLATSSNDHKRKSDVELTVKSTKSKLGSACGVKRARFTERDDSQGEDSSPRFDPAC